MFKPTKNVYIACSMIKSKQIDFSLLDFIVNWVEKQGYQAFVPGKMEDATPKIIFERDLNWLKQSNVIIADVNEPSHGVGMEIMYAYEHSIPVLCLLNEGNKPLSRMVEGSPHIQLLTYTDNDSLTREMNKFSLIELQVMYCENCDEKTFHLNKICEKC